jgi:GAF domain-containing protein
MEVAGTPASDNGVSAELLGVTSLARAVAGDAGLSDVGSLAWMMIKQMLPCASMGLFLPEERNDTVVGAYAAGHHAGAIREFSTTTGNGLVGWVAAHRRPATNAEPALDLGLHAASLEPPLLSALVIPLVHEGSLEAVLAVYATTRNAFSEDHARLMELLAPTLASSIAAVRGKDESRIGVPVARTTTAIPHDLKLLKGRRTATG